MRNSEKNTWHKSIPIGVLLTLFQVLSFLLMPIGSARTDAVLLAPVWMSIQEIPGGVDLRWFRVQEATGYIVERRQGLDGPYQEVARVRNPLYGDFLVKRGITYFYRIVPYGQDGIKGNPSEERYILLPEDLFELIQPPEWGVVRPMPGGVALTWSHSDRKSVLAFNLYKRIQGEGAFLLLTSTVDSTFLDRGVQEGVSYEYAVTALDRKLQESDYSKAVMVKYKWSVAATVTRRPEQNVRILEEVVRRTELSRFYSWEQYGFVSPVDVDYLPSTQNLYIADSGTGLITILNYRGNVIQKLGGTGDEPWKFDRLMGLTVDANGTVFATDAYKGQLVVYDARGIFQYRISLLEELEEYFGPSFYLEHPGFRFGLIDVALGFDGSLFVTDNPNGWLYFLNTNDHLVNVVSEKGEGHGQMHFPTFLAVGGRGRIFVSDTLNSRLQVFGPKGTPNNLIGQRGLGIGQFIRPKGLALDGSGLLFVADSFLNAIQVFTTEGDYVGLLGDEKGLPLDLGLPNGIAFIPPDKLAVTEKISRRVQVRTLKMDLLRPLSGVRVTADAEEPNMPASSTRTTLQERLSQASELANRVRLLAEEGGTLTIRDPLFVSGSARLQGAAYPLLQQVSLLVGEPHLDVWIEVFAVKDGEAKGSLALGQERVKSIADLLPKGADNLHLYSIVSPKDGVFQDRIDLIVTRSK